LEDKKYQERNDYFIAHRAPSLQSVKTILTARPSLYPVTELPPGFKDNRNATSAAQSALLQSAWERPIARNKHNRENPFSNYAEAVNPINAAGPGDKAMAGRATTSAVISPARSASKRDNGPKPLDFTQKLPEIGQPSPSGTKFSISEASRTPVAAAGAVTITVASGPQNAIVHYIRLNFKPLIEDKLKIHNS
jgi:hypothetical protein